MPVKKLAKEDPYFIDFPKRIKAIQKEPVVARARAVPTS